MRSELNVTALILGAFYSPACGHKSDNRNKVVILTWNDHLPADNYRETAVRGICVARRVIVEPHVDRYKWAKR